MSMSSATSLAPPTRSARQHRPATVLAALFGVSLIGLMVAAPASAAAPIPGQQQPPGTEGLTTMLSWAGWLVSFVCVVGFLVVAAMMATKHRRGEGGAEAMASLGWVCGGCVVGAAAGTLAGALI